MTTAPIIFTIQLTDEQIAAIAAIAAERVNCQAQPDPWMTVDQAAVYLACGRQRVYNLVSQRRLRHVKDGSRVLFRRQWLDDILEGAS